MSVVWPAEAVEAAAKARYCGDGDSLGGNQVEWDAAHEETRDYYRDKVRWWIGLFAPHVESMLAAVRAETLDEAMKAVESIAPAREQWVGRAWLSEALMALAALRREEP